ncbi:uncharacterized oxidoreductase YrbE-like [Ptychodera flava]|uniref:uncharacterized oxidoreductase YrbE-like n=1 Tax=Ptychodera flava TaxID=63121 RepID=UPI003969E670
MEVCKDRQVGIAIFGLGRAGGIHFKNIVANYRTSLKWIVEEDLEKAHTMVKKYFLDDTRVSDSKDITPVLEDNCVDAVVVCTPTHTHEQIVRAALKAGKAVFCEKPIARTVEGTQGCYDDAEKYGIALYCALNRRFDPAIRSVVQRVKAGEIGQIHQIKTTSRDAPLPPLSYLKISGGIFHDCIVHDLDMICWIVGETPSTVYAQAHCFNADIAAMDDVDTVAVILKFPCGTLAQIDISRHAAYGYDQRLEVFGSEGMLHTSNSKPLEVSSHGHRGTLVDKIHGSFPERYEQSYLLEMEHFLDVVTGVESKIEITREDTALSSLLAEACEQSYRLGKPIHIADGKMTDMNGFKKNGFY